MRVLTVVLLAIAALPAMATESRPEITRPAGTPQAVGALHTVRGIPEACVRLEGVFTGAAAPPYKLVAVKTHPDCRARARFVDFAQAQPSEAKGWKLNDVIRVQSKSCASLQAVVRVWRMPGDVAPPALDAQGRARIYLKEASERAKAQGAPKLPLYAAQLRLEGNACPPG